MFQLCPIQVGSCVDKSYHFWNTSIFYGSEDVLGPFCTSPALALVVIFPRSLARNTEEPWCNSPGSHTRHSDGRSICWYRGASRSKNPGLLNYHVEVSCSGLTVLFPWAKRKPLLCKPLRFWWRLLLQHNLVYPCPYTRSLILNFLLLQSHFISEESEREWQSLWVHMKQGKIKLRHSIWKHV